ncbi:MAG TPA: FAD-dependent oxidoreductase [Chloroflexia bacterium]|nr:FAD-dependent oxidoreductase [Chloroflexia bacterium]
MSQAAQPIQPRVAYTHDLPRTADLVIVGGGIVGAATAFFAARAGLRALVLERRPALCTLTTPASTGAFRAQFDNPEEIALVSESMALFANFAQATGLEGYDLDMRRQGYLWLTTSEAGVGIQKELVARQHAWGLTDVEWFDGDEARRRFPYLSPDVIGARFRAGDGWLDVRRLTLGYAAAASTGAVFATNTAVAGFDVQGGKVGAVHTSRGSVSTGRVVVAAGPFAGEVAGMAGLELPLSLVRRQKLVMPDVPEVPAWAPMTIDEETGAHWRPALRGANLLRTSPGVPPGPPLEDVPISVDFVFGLLDPASEHSVARISPFWREVWARQTCHYYLQAGQYSYTPDHKPFLGPTPIEGFYLNCGYSGHGIMASGGGSRIVVDAITGSLRPEDNPFRLDRPLVGRHMDIL